MSDKRARLKSAKTIVIKIGSALLTDNGKGLNRPQIADWVEQIADIIDKGIQVVLVSSGAVAEGIARKGILERPKKLSELQAVAAIGQTGLVEAYQAEFSRFGVQTAQILLVHDDIVSEQRYENAKATLQTLIEWQAVPIVNENDSVANEELKFGDNDFLAAMVANIVDADALIILTDQMGMYDADPRSNASAALIHEAVAGDASLLAMAGSGGKLGRGGMYTKVKAAELAACVAADTVIVGGLAEQVLLRLLDGETLGTLLYSNPEGSEERKAWFESLRRGDA